MQVTVEIPDQFVQHLVPNGVSASRALLEEAVAGAYRDGRLTTTEQVRQLLGFGTRMQAVTFLGRREISIYTIEEFEKDMVVFERMFPSKPDQSQA